MRARIAVTCVVGVVASCDVHDDFSDRVRRGCNSESECVSLIGAARYRLMECVTSGRSSRRDTSLIPNWDLVEGVCSYEYQDFLLASRKGRQWAAQSRFKPIASGEVLSTSVQVLEPAADAGEGAGRPR